MSGRSLLRAELLRRKAIAHPNAERLKLATVDGYIISTSIDSAEGIYVYSPVECVINSDFLKVNNLYRQADLNLDPTKQGFFEESGRVKCIKLRGLASEVKLYHKSH